MFFLTKRYNEVDFFKNLWLDLLVQFFHIITLLQLFYVIIDHKYIFIALFCAYTLFENIKWFLGSDTVYEYDSEDDEDKNEEDDNNEEER